MSLILRPTATATQVREIMSESVCMHVMCVILYNPYICVLGKFVSP